MKKVWSAARLEHLISAFVARALRAEEAFRAGRRPALTDESAPENDFACSAEDGQQSCGSHELEQADESVVIAEPS